MDPVSLAGLAIGVASIGFQVYTGCVQGIQLLITAQGYDNECKYLNLRLRLEQQRLYAWSEASGLLDADAKDREKILDSNIFNLHRQVVLDLLLQTKCLFDEFIALQKKHSNLTTVADPNSIILKPEMDAKQASFPMTQRKRDLIRKVMVDLVSSSSDVSSKAFVRLKWVSLDKEAFEILLSKFSALNDSMTSMLDQSLQLEIRHTVSDTNRGVLLLHEKVDDIGHLVMALSSELKMRSPGSLRIGRKSATDSLTESLQLAQFKGFHEDLDTNTTGRRPGGAVPVLPRHLHMSGGLITSEGEESRCMAYLSTPRGRQEIWIEWKDYSESSQHPGSLSKIDIVDRVHKLAALLNRTPKPESFCTPHCLGFFDRAESAGEEADSWHMQRLGLVFQRPSDEKLDPQLPPISLRQLLEDKNARKPRLTERVRVAHALSNCLLYLHAVNWLHKGIRSHNILFWRFTGSGEVNFDRPVLSGFDFARPSGSDEMTEMPSADDIEQDLYRHPLTQQSRSGMRERSNKSFDIYSLGVVLVELAHWRTVDDILDIDLRKRSRSAEKARDVKELLLEPVRLNEIGANMGERYEEATRKCLAGETGLEPPAEDQKTAGYEEAQRLQRGFHEGVVRKLAEIQV